MPLLSAAQAEKRFLLYDSENGLSNNYVHVITRDSDGLMWFGTQDGLNSFDGNYFKAYKHNASDSNSISDQFVLSITEDKNKNLWVGTRSGLNYFNKKTQQFRRFYLSENEKHIFQSSYDYVALQNDNKVLLKNDGLIQFDGRSGTKKQLQKKEADVMDWLAMPDYSGWMFSQSGKVYFYPDLRKQENILKGKHNIPAKVYSFTSLKLSDSIVCLYNFSTADSIYFFNTKTHSVNRKLAVPKFSFQLVESAGRFLLCNSDGIYERSFTENDSWKLIRPTAFNGLPSSGFLSGFTDKEGNTWLGSSGGGVAVHNPNFELFRTIPTMAPGERVNGIAVAANTVYVATHSGLYKIKDITATHPVFEPVLKNVFISAVTTDKENNIWAAEFNGDILQINSSGKIIKRKPMPEPGLRQTVFNLFTDRRGRVHISTSKGYYYFDPAFNENIQALDTSGHKPVSKYVLHAFEDDINQLWLSGYHGIDILNAAIKPVKSFKSFNDKESFLQRTIITSVTQDKEGVMWIATIRNGVYRYTGKGYTHYTHNDGLSSDIAYNIVCDNNNRIWVCTSAGLNVFDKNEKTFKSIPAFDGISKTAFSLGAVATYEDDILFGATGKIVLVKAGDYRFKKEKLDAFISDVKINGQSIDLSSHQITLVPDNKLIQFEFGYSPGFYSGNILYQYRVLGIDSNWKSLPVGSSSISYTGLPYKKLVMQVRAASSLNNLKNAGLYSLNIYAQPPFYKKIWFIILMAIAFLGLTFLLVYLYNKRRYQRQLQVLKMEKELHKERSRIGRDLHDNIGAYTSALIAGLNRVKPADELQDKNLDDLKEYGNSIMGLLRETIWMLNAEELTVTAFADRFINYAMRINKNYPDIDMQFVEKISNDKKLQPGIMLNLFRILQEALQNALKHSMANKIEINIESADTLIFTINDNGRGFDGNTVEGHYGIDNMKARAKEIGFVLTITTAMHAGTSVALTQNTANA